MYKPFYLGVPHDHGNPHICSDVSRPSCLSPSFLSVTPLQLRCGTWLREATSGTWCSHGTIWGMNISCIDDVGKAAIVTIPNFTIKLRGAINHRTKDGLRLLRRPASSNMDPSSAADLSLSTPKSWINTHSIS